MPSIRQSGTVSHNHYPSFRDPRLTFETEVSVHHVVLVHSALLLSAKESLGPYRMYLRFLLMRQFILDRTCVGYGVFGRRFCTMLHIETTICDHLP